MIKPLAIFNLYFHFLGCYYKTKQLPSWNWRKKIISVVITTWTRKNLVLSRLLYNTRRYSKTEIEKFVVHDGCKRGKCRGLWTALASVENAAKYRRRKCPVISRSFYNISCSTARFRYQRNRQDKAYYFTVCLLLCNVYISHKEQMLYYYFTIIHFLF